MEDILIKPVLQASLLFHYSLETAHFPISPLQWGTLSTALQNIDHLFLLAMQITLEEPFVGMKW